MLETPTSAKPIPREIHVPVVTDQTTPSLQTSESDQPSRPPDELCANPAQESLSPEPIAPEPIAPEPIAPEPIAPEPTDYEDETSDAATADARQQTRGLTFLLTGVVFLMGYWVLVGRWDIGELELERLPRHHWEYRLNINTANAMEFSVLPGIGPKLSRTIVAERHAGGPFQSPNDFLRVKGIGPRSLERLAPYFTGFGTGSTSESPNNSQSSKSLPSTDTKILTDNQVDKTTSDDHRPSGLVDLNAATIVELDRLPGIGPVLAERIIAHRAIQGPFKTLDDLRKVSGIGPKTLRRLAPYVIVSPQPVPATSVGGKSP